MRRWVRPDRTPGAGAAPGSSLLPWHDVAAASRSDAPPRRSTGSHEHRNCHGGTKEAFRAATTRWDDPAVHAKDRAIAVGPPEGHALTADRRTERTLARVGTGAVFAVGLLVAV